MGALETKSMRSFIQGSLSGWVPKNSVKMAAVVVDLFGSYGCLLAMIDLDASNFGIVMSLY